MAGESKIRALIVDDETPARARIRQLLKLEPDFVVIGECSNGGQAVEAICKQRPDLVFLDVQMPRLSGLEVCRQVVAAGAELPVTIFVTAFDSYALNAFEVHAVDYLLKPFDQERFGGALAHARKQLSRSQQVDIQSRLAAALEDLTPGAVKPGRLVFKENGRIIFVRPESIDWIEADGNYVRIHTQDGSHYIRETLAALESQLSPGNFLRISRSNIVNLDRIKELQPLFYGDYTVILHNGCKLSMSRSYKDRLESIFQKRR
ncbi:MAG TPA: LytTR family DNA-binding domain-containing protein [Verrucomicrobiae bacterium]|nr:LytTR family DNA-binding domain-containing protein [Verrucomicrobiae bacterium]